MWLDHLSDNIYSVRNNSAKALARVYQDAEIYRDDLYAKFGEYLSENLMKAKEQTEHSHKHTNLQNETQFGVAKPVADADHENNQMFSCGSLAPKLKRGGGCMDHGFTRHTELWEYSDGCIFLIKELSKVRCESDAKVVSKVVELISKHIEDFSYIGFIDHFKHAAHMKEHLFKSASVLCSPEGLGKKKFRPFVEIFMDPTFRNTNHSTQNCAVAAQDFLITLEKVYGENITKAIIESQNPSYLEEFMMFKQASMNHVGDFVYP